MIAWKIHELRANSKSWALPDVWTLNKEINNKSNSKVVEAYLQSNKFPQNLCSYIFNLNIYLAYLYVIASEKSISCINEKLYYMHIYCQSAHSENSSITINLGTRSTSWLGTQLKSHNWNWAHPCVNIEMQQLPSQRFSLYPWCSLNSSNEI